MSTGPWNEEELKTALDEAVRRSMTNLEYRQLLLTDAAAALKKIDDRPLPPRIKLVFSDTGVTTRLISLPSPGVSVQLGLDELSEEELDKVAGGGGLPGTDTYGNCNLTI